jgi:hypothetical protein
MKTERLNEMSREFQSLYDQGCDLADQLVRIETAPEKERIRKQIQDVHLQIKNLVEEYREIIGGGRFGITVSYMGSDARCGSKTAQPIGHNGELTARLLLRELVRELG